MGKFKYLMLCLLLFCGCVTGGQSTNWRMQSIESGLQEQQKQQESMNQRLQELEARVAEMQGLLELYVQGRPAIRERSLDGGAEEKPSEVSAASESQARAAAVPATTTRSPERIEYETALNTLRAGEAEKAKALFNRFIAQHPESSLLPNAMYWLGECYYLQKHYAQSILTFKEVARRYPKHQKASDSLLKTAMAYERLGDLENARFHLRILTQDYPKTPSAEKARAMLNTMP